jgi:hypothetical protein
MNNLTIIPCPGDGSCFFHCVLLARSQEYQMQMINNKRVTKTDIVRQFRIDLSNLLNTKINNDINNPTWYEYLSRGQLEDISKSMDEFSLSSLQEKLLSMEPIGQEFIEFVSDVTNTDIYIVDAEIKQLYNLGDKEILYKNRPSILIFYHDNHYDLLGKQLTDGTLQVVFEPNDIMIKTLYNSF